MAAFLPALFLAIGVLGMGAGALATMGGAVVGTVAVGDLASYRPICWTGAGLGLLLFATSLIVLLTNATPA